MMIDCPSSTLILGASIRANTSVAPPGANGTTNLIGALNSRALGDEAVMNEPKANE
jgi:hypothetical protein